MNWHEEKHPAPTLAYATPDRGLRPGAALWVAAAFVWALAAGVAGVAVLQSSRLDGVLIALMLAAGFAMLQWEVVVDRSASAARMIAAAAALACVPAWVAAYIAAAALLGMGGTMRVRNEPTMCAIAIVLAVGLTFVAVTHAAWARRLRRA